MFHFLKVTTKFHLCLPMTCATERCAKLFQLFACAGVNCAIDATSAKQRRSCGVLQSINVAQLGDVASPKPDATVELGIWLKFNKSCFFKVNLGVEIVVVTRRIALVCNVVRRWSWNLSARIVEPTRQVVKRNQIVLILIRDNFWGWSWRSK